MLKAYNKAVLEEKKYKVQKEDIWTVLETNIHSEFISLLNENNPVSLAKYLCNISLHNITHGLSQGQESYRMLKLNREIREIVAILYKDKLVSLAESLGSICYENPEQGSWAQNIYLDTNVIIDKIEKTIGLELKKINYLGGLFGLKTKRGIIDARYLYALYTALRIVNILEEKNLNKSSICEIGGGIGHVAFFLNYFGTNNYLIFDLPYICVISGYFLLKSLKGKVFLYGEKIKNKKNIIKIYPYWMLAKMKD
ncbi:MAG: hypothetical protein GYA62_06210, partial [Bacteroidales bacterium]|nr:hypothetical protein [Bacteroidales bacterium]